MRATSNTVRSKSPTIHQEPFTVSSLFDGETFCWGYLDIYGARIKMRKMDHLSILRVPSLRD